MYVVHDPLPLQGKARATKEGNDVAVAPVRFHAVAYLVN